MAYISLAPGLWNVVIKDLAATLPPMTPRSYLERRHVSLQSRGRGGHVRAYP